ncbi:MULTISPECIES: hypothetical protein [unclassified Corallococcus]|uniref:hypothetical protein n=1 Tax=unclassified Corallococcus TaxID=2685029 RepID=UPI001A90317D|nr:MULTISPECIES: hypothetical protein [unclassified Corallococcus]MBN9684017.1 hypothetical protein [Corallococcus sp. NCSPR001]WAS84487.1 hypothetical protein O0N60_35095 [Corallococcus sp. NCRR]
MANKKNEDVKPVKHVEATRPEPWPGIQGRSQEHEEDLETGTRRAEQAGVTEAQRKLEKDEPTRE